jgi:hypothetical protein
MTSDAVTEATNCRFSRLRYRLPLERLTLICRIRLVTEHGSPNLSTEVTVAVRTIGQSKVLSEWMKT